MAKYICFHLHIFPIDIESNHLFLSGKLYQEYTCEAWAIAKQNCLNFLRQNQGKLCVEVYNGLVDTIAANRVVHSSHYLAH
jgi:Helitron helicase-like domain at N-terminus